MSSACENAFPAEQSRRKAREQTAIFLRMLKCQVVALDHEPPDPDDRATKSGSRHSARIQCDCPGRGGGGRDRPLAHDLPSLATRSTPEAWVEAAGVTP